MIEKYTNGAWAELAGYKKYGEITFDLSSFPASFQSGGLDMSDYRIYGANDGVGERTENLFDISLVEQGGWEPAAGTIPRKYDSSSSQYRFRCRYNVIIPLLATTLSLHCPSNIKINYVFVDANGISLGGSGWQRSGDTATAPEQAASITFILSLDSEAQCTPSDFYDINIVAGSTAPAQYIPFGYQINAVVRSENLFDKDAQDPGNGFMNGYYLFEDGRTLPYSGYQISEYIAASEQTIYYLFSFVDSGSAVSICFYGENKTFISGERILGKESVVSPFGARFLRITIQTTLRDNSTLTISPSAPTQYIPYSRTDIPIYIGDAPLAQGEYVDYRAQKVYKYVGGVLTPTDPPVALPALPTIDGTTVADFDNEPKPSRMTGEAIGWRTMTPKIYENGAWI